jgi:pimeloyl-ACP methyl ester carboxylesterase
MSRAAFALLALAAALAAQRPTADELKKLVRQALEADEAAWPVLREKLAALPALSKADAKTWTDFVRKWIRTSPGPKLEGKGQSYFYDPNDKDKRKGKYFVAGAGNKKGLVFGLHGGGEGQADAGPASSSFRGAIQAAGMVGIFPEAIQATEAAWGDDITVKFFLDLLSAARRTFDFDDDRVYVIGHSMGGYGAWTWGGRFSDRLAAVISFAGCPTPIFEDGDRAKPVCGVQTGVLPNLRNVPIWVYHSIDDRNVPFPPLKFAVTELKKLAAANPGEYLHNYEEVADRGHAFPAKGPGPALDWASKFERRSRPERVTWQAFYTEPDTKYWLLWDRPAAERTLQATWKGSTFEIEGEGRREDVGVQLDDSMLDLDRPVKVLFNHQTIFEGVAPRSLAVLVASARRRSDPGLLFTAVAR